MEFTTEHKILEKEGGVSFARTSLSKKPSLHRADKRAPFAEKRARFIVPLREEAGMELERGGEMLGEVGGIVAAGIEMEFVRDAARGEDFVEGGGTGVEAVVVVVAAVEIDFKASEIRRACKDERAVLVPENGIGRIAKNAAEYAPAWRCGRAAEKAGEFFDQRGAVGADGAEKLRMAEGEMQCAIAAHGDTGDGTVGAAGRDAVAFFDEREKFLQQKIFVAVPAVFCIDIKTRAALRRGDQKTFQFAFFALVFDKVPRAGVDEELLVVAKSVEVIEDGKVFCLVRIKRRRENDAVRNAARKDFAGDGVTFDASGGGGGERKEV